MKNIFLLVVLALVCGLSACKKGEMGDIGPQGTAGAKGAQGLKGDQGSLNSVGMLSSDWLVVKGTDWTSSGVPNTFGANFTWGALTADIITKGDIHMYFRSTTQTDLVYPLPYVFPNTGVRYFWLAAVVNNKPTIGIYRQNVASANPGVDLAVRVVAVPPGTSSGRLAHVDWNNYKEVKEALNLKD